MAIGLLGWLASSAAAQTHTVNLIAAPLTKSVSLPNGTSVGVPMWGFGLDADANGVLNDGEAPTVPGPRITVPVGSTTLVISLTNALTGPGAEPVSVVVPGQAFDATVVRRPDGRIQSMTKETAPGVTSLYTFTNLKPGTFLYESGTHPAVQVQMGLYGAVTMDAAAGQAYAGVAYDHEVLLLYSEIDIALHQAVASGVYGTPSGPTSTIDYAPSLFLINGESYANELSVVESAGAPGERTLLRLLNAGLRTHAPLLDNGLLTIVAEDGNASPFARSQAAILLSAGKTHDATWTPASAGVYSLYDRMLSLNAEGQAPAGMLAKLRVSSTIAEPVSAADDGYATDEDTALSIGAAGVLGNDSGSGLSSELITGTHGGSVALNADGSFDYTPNANFFGVDSFTYRVSDGVNVSLAATVSITVNPISDPPIALPIAIGVDAGAEVPVTLQGTDADGDPLTFYVTALPASGTLIIVDPVTHIEQMLAVADLSTGPGTGTAIPAALVIYRPDPGTPPAPPPFSGEDSFQFVASDTPSAASAAAAVTATVHPPEAADAPLGNPFTIAVVGSDGAAVSAYYWTVEEDQTYEVLPGLADPNTLAVRFHASYMPVRQSGDETTQPILDPAVRYFISVLPRNGGYSNGGASIARDQSSATITVNANPIPTAQIRVRVFNDNGPLNAAWDTTESGLANFEVFIEDAGGRYGMSAGQQAFDAFGNQIGTIYGECSTGPGTCESFEVVQYGQGFVLTDAEGWALIQNLPPGKYGVKVRAPGGAEWQQTTTIEGTKVLDAWVKANEPQFFQEFGPPGPHAEVGFVQKMRNTSILGAGPGPFSAITGQVTNLHTSRPPNMAMFGGAPFDFTQPWVALNQGVAGGTLIYAQPTDPDGNFAIEGVPSGSYQLTYFDSALDVIIANKVINVTGGADVTLGEQPVIQWFTRTYHYVFEDLNENGFRDAGEPGIPEQAVNIRWRDGTMNQSSATDGSGFVPFEEVFPFFAWQVAEVDYARFKATGVTVVVDNGGNPKVNTGWPAQVGAGVDSAVLAPQPQSENGGAGYRTETGPVLLEAFQGFVGQSNVMLWGKLPYAEPGSIAADVNVAPFDDFPGPDDTDANGNGTFDVDQFLGGITGVVHYSTTRAESDPRWGTGEPWEPGIPNVRVQLWDTSRKHLLNEVVTDSWDASQPAGCQGEVFVFLGQATDCYDGMRNWNQVRPGVFDGGYAFYTVLEPLVDELGAAVPLEARTIQRPLPAGNYIVKVIPPSGYKLVKEEDKNVDFGEQYIPQQFYLTGYPLADGAPAEAPPGVTVEEYPLVAPFCVGTAHEVAPELALFPGMPSAYAGDKRPLCDAKLVNARNGSNAAANFFVFTEAPIAGHIFGFVLDDTTNEYDPNSPQFGEKFAPPFLPVAIRDWTGREITRTYTDQYGRYNVLVPSTFTAAVPQPSGMSPNMLTACINAPMMLDPGGSGVMVPDPLFQKQYSHFCYTLQYMPGATTYLDTPVVPTGAFTGSDTFPVDAELPDTTPVAAQVTSTFQPSGVGTGIVPRRIGPYIVDRGTDANLDNRRLRTIEIRSAGDVQVPNPYYEGIGSLTDKAIYRDYGFGAASRNGIVRLGGLPITVTTWTNSIITAVVPTGLSYRTGELSVERCLTPGKPLAGTTCPGESRRSVTGITLTVAGPTMNAQRPPVVLAAGQTIQSVIDAATTRPGDLVLVPPGTYNEMVVMRKPVRLQGWGASGTVINTVQVPAEIVQVWRDYVGNLLAADSSYLLPDQLNIIGPPPFEPGGITAGLGGEGAPVTVLAKNQPRGLLGICLGTTASPSNEAYCLQNENPGFLAIPVLRPNARVDGFSLIGSSGDAGVFVNAYARFFEIGNNRIFNNMGYFGGGIRVGHPGATAGLVDEDAGNADISIHHNVVTQNAGLDGGGGIVLGTGSDRYQVSNNFVAGNFSGGWGAGVTHLGLSQGGVIDHNAVIFNETFNQGLTRAGAGIFVGGRPPIAGGLTPGSGNVRINNNLIQGNQAAGGDGGGIALLGVNGQDIVSFSGPILSLLRYRVNLFDNVIVNNVSALAGGGVSLQDAAYVQIVHNTIAHNDSLATAGAAFLSPTTSDPQPAGVVSRGHTPQLALVLGTGFSDPRIANSIVWENRSFSFGPVSGGVVQPGDPNPTPIQYGLIANASSPIWDLGVLGAPAGSQLDPTYSVLTVPTGYDASNSGTAPTFVATYFNGSRNPTIIEPDGTPGIMVPAAFDEGGNFIRPLFGPLTLTAADTSFFANYHVNTGQVGQGLNVLYGLTLLVPAPLLFDVDDQPRPVLVGGGIGPHRGADQRVASPTPPPTPPLPWRY